MIFQRRYFIVFAAILLATLLLSWQNSSKPSAGNPFNPHQRGGSPDSLFEGYNSLFASSGTCDHCHGLDPAGLASVDAAGNDINVVDDWASSIMANSARDPFWRAKVSHEVLLNPDLQEEIESTCTKCHAPLGNFHAQFNEQDHYSIAEMEADEMALDGVSCLACHQQLPQPDVAQHTGQLIFDPNRMAYGPYEGPLVTPMALYSEYVPEYGSHINDAKLCAGCHSLITQTVDLDGVPTGEDFIEQATWHEWLNSSYSTDNITCQSCHLPRVEKSAVVLAAGFDTPGREPFGLHTLAGGNTLMLSIMRDNREQLGIAATEEQFNNTIEATFDNLQQQSLTLQATALSRTEDTVFVRLRLTNLTGHKLPSGYPARRMSVHVVMRDMEGNELFRSGGFDPEFYINGEDLPFEPHHQVVRNAEQVQIYEMVMGDVNGNKTTVLERAAVHLKDNRLVPQGFLTSHPQYDSTAYYLNEVEDPDFNFAIAEGSGTDMIYYHIPTEGYVGQVQVTAEVYYQSLPPSFMEEMFTASTPEIDAWQDMFSAADRSPVLMRSGMLDIPAFVGVPNTNGISFAAFAVPQAVQVSVPAPGDIQIYDSRGSLVATFKNVSTSRRLPLNVSTGSYLVVYTRQDGQREVKKILVVE